MNTAYAVYAYKVNPKHERGSVDYYFSAMAEEIGNYPTRAGAVRKAVAYKDRYWCGVQVVKLIYDEDGNEIDEQTLESFTP